MTQPPTITFIGEFDESRLGDDAVAEVQLFSAATTTGDLRAMLRKEVDREVTQILDLVTGCDAYDVVQFLRVSELAGGPQPTEATQGSALVIEIVAAALLGRGSRAPTDHDPQITGPPHGLYRAPRSTNCVQPPTASRGWRPTDTCTKRESQQAPTPWPS